MFPEYKNLNLSKICSETASFWKEKDVFLKSVKAGSASKNFVFYEGPPSANGLPGIHHVMARVIKDVFCRYKTLCGFRVERRAGWDTHGLPVELSVEKELNIKKDDIGTKISISDYNRACKKTVMKYTEVWNSLTEEMGYWVDMKNPYVTYKSKYIETVWFLIKKLFDQKVIYKGYTIQPYSPAAGTGLSSHELSQPGCYRLVKDLSVFPLFRVLEPEKIIKTSKPVFFVAWTTTPWTLFANTGLAVGNNIKYVVVETINPYTLCDILVVCAEDCLDRVFDKKTSKLILKHRKKNTYTILSNLLGSDLIGLKYEQLLKYVQPLESPDLAFRVVGADFVSTKDGTGIVHLAPTFGADDFSVAKKNNLPLMLVEDSKKNHVPIVNLNGCLVDGLGDFSGRFVKEDFDDTKSGSVDVDIVVKLKKDGLAFRSEKYEHSYPHCWRTDKPILYYPLDSWFIKTTKYKELLVKKNKEINWKPPSTGEGRFQNWLENINDWNLSRSRFWGIPLPIWKTEDDTEFICVGSLEELKSLCEDSVSLGNMKTNPLDGFVCGDMSDSNYDLFDLHKNFVDQIVLSSEGGRPMYREPDVIDVWFDSGSMPYAQWHYPFENKKLIDSGSCFPADFIAEGVDQTRGWFFTLHAIAVMCFGQVAFKNVVSNGLVLDNVGQKMSKRLGNAVEPFEVIKTHGADAVRWYMISNSQPWDNLKFDINGVIDVKKRFFSTLYNTYSFFSLYANIDGFKYGEHFMPVSSRPILDQWILSELNTLICVVGDAYLSYEPTLASRAIQSFVIEKLSNWYVRLCRRRFWRGAYDESKVSAYQTLYDCLVSVAKIASPIAPFFMDRLFCDLNSCTKKESVISVHLSSFPVSKKSLSNSGLEKKMKLTKSVCSLALSLRKRENIRVRQPLDSVVVCLDGGKEDCVFVDLIKSEINVKNIVFEDYSKGVVKRKLVVNFPLVGKKHGRLVKDIVHSVSLLDESDIDLFEKNGKINLPVLGESVWLLKDELFVKTQDVPGLVTAKNEDALVVLNSLISPELKKEGFAREFVNKVQSIRRELNLNVTDNINLFLNGDKEACDIIMKYENYISGEVLSKKIAVCNGVLKNGVVFEFDDYKLYIELQIF